MMADRKLGRGLEGLMQAVTHRGFPDAAPPASPVTALPVALLDPNPFQPRQGIEAEELEQLKTSIMEHGVLQPIVVRANGDRYQVIAGERRFRAAQAAGLLEVPVVTRVATDEEMLELALVENLQRSDLDPIEKAASFKSYLDRSGKTQEAASVRLGVDRSTIANMIRLLELPAEVQGMVRAGLVAMGHARAILAITDPKRQLIIAERVAREGLSVRQVEKITGAVGVTKRRGKAAAKNVHARDLEAKLREALGTKVSVEEGPKPGSGKIVIEFYNLDDLDRIIARLG
jgi:ParB family transcriptional regulator, chromosome partitioning protein